jgi:hypothetical protein
MTYVCLALIAFCVYREVVASRERRSLLQRIQAPEIAVRQFAERHEHVPVVPVPVDDDDAFAEARERRKALNGSGD